ncbi:N-6 DNA methylase [Enterococcus casseliflavus]|uniref:N-6 DNA methylase n=1 Tax=Enterococcus casseliflavus TaxID=37734 RepID=UPI003D0D8951
MKDKRNYQKMITTKLQSLSGKQNISTVFFDWIHAMAYAFSNSADKAQFEEREAAYMVLIRKYTKEEANVFADCLGLLTMAFEYKVQDWLGAIYMDLNINSKNSGQFFTPSNIAELMARMTFTNNEPLLEEKGWIGYYEPCVGAGSMVLAFAKAMESGGYNYQTQLRVQCEDIDENCLLMAYVQLSLCGINAVCKVKNSLSGEEASTWYTPFYIINPAWITRKKQTPATEPKKIKKEEPDVWVIPEDSEQLALF